MCIRDSSTTRPVWDIVRANLFTFFNNLLFVIGAALIVLGQWLSLIHI